MKTYSQGFIDDKNTFKTETHIYFSQCSKNKVLSLTELLRLTSDIAVEDYANRGMSREFLAEHNIAILVSRNSFKIHKMPKENQDVIVLTREEKPEAFQLVRSYEFVSMNGESLISGLSTWIAVDIQSRKIIPSKNFTLREAPDVSFEHDCKMPARITLGEEAKELAHRVVGYSDLDSNGHVNNSRYGNYITDVLPMSIIEGEIAEFRINYSKEALLGEEITLYGSFSSDGKSATVAGKTANGTSFEAQVIAR